MANIEHDSKDNQVDLTPDSYAKSLRPSQEEDGAPEVFDQTRPVRFAGLIGDDNSEETVRIYLDYELSTFIVFNRADVIRRERVKNMGGVEVSVLFVKHDATVVVREISSEKVRADVLSDALIAAENGAFPSATNLGFTPATPTITRTITIATALLCTKFLCTLTSRHSLTCTITCTNHPVCPNPWTKNWFC